MSRPATRGGSVLGPKTVLAFGVGVSVGLVLVAPVIPETAGKAIGGIIEAGGTVILIGVLALALLMVILAILYQGYLKA